MSIQPVLRQIQHQEFFGLSDVQTSFATFLQEGFKINQTALEFKILRKTPESISDGRVQGTFARLQHHSTTTYHKDINPLHATAKLVDTFRRGLENFREDNKESSLEVDIKIEITGAKLYKNQEDKCVMHTKTSEIKMSVKGELPLFFPEPLEGSTVLSQIQDGSVSGEST